MESMFWLDRGEKPPGDHRIFYGVKGTGKTTFLVAAGSVAACLMQNTLPIYWTYEKQGSYEHPPFPLHLVQAADDLSRLPTSELSCHMFDGHVYRISCTQDGMFVPTSKLRPLLFLDDFTTLYYPAGTPGVTEEHRARGVKIMRSLVTLGKERNSSIFLAASHHNVDRYIYPDRVADMHLSTYGAYPNMNNGVFICRQILPLRDIASITAYFEKRYRRHLIAEEAADVLARTGGVGRWMAIYQGRRSFTPDNHWVRINADPRLFRLCTHIVSQPSTNESIPLAEAVQLLLPSDETHRASVHAQIEATNLLDSWCDDLLLLLYDNQVHFLTPYSAAQFRQLLAQTEELHCAAVLHLTHSGFKRESAMHKHEWLFSKYIHTFLDLQPASDDVVIKIREGATTFELNDGEDGPTFDESRYCGRWIQWKAEEGLDGVWLEMTPRNTIRISGAQFKSGQATKHITPGVLATQRRCKELGKQLNDATIAGILVKAESGISKVARALATQMGVLVPPLQLELGDFHIFTDKHAAEGFRSFCRKYVEGEDENATEQKQRLDDDMDELEFELQTHSPLPTINNSIFVQVHDASDNWMQDILPRLVYDVAYRGTTLAGCS